MKSAVLASVMILPVLAGLNSLREPAVAPAPVVLPCVALSGADSQIGEKSYLRITNENDWVKLWRNHKGDQSGGEYDFEHDPLGLPIVDFNQFMVLALFEGRDESPDGFQADSISESPEEMTIRFLGMGNSTGFAKEFEGNPECSVEEPAAPVRHAYGFFFVPKSSKAIVLQKMFKNSNTDVFKFPALK